MSERGPDGCARPAPPRSSPGLVFVAVRRSSRHGYTLRRFRAPGGGHTVVGFTTRARLTAALGADHAAVGLALPALRALVEPLGATSLTIDPAPVTAAPAPAGPPGPARALAPPPALTPAPA